jgi:hypothetical protein
MSIGANQIIRKAVAGAAGVDARAGLGMLGRRFMSNTKNLSQRHVRNAMLARAAIGAVGGSAYSIATGGDWKQGAMGGAFLGAGVWSVGGLNGLRRAGVRSGLLSRKTKSAGIAKATSTAENAVAAGTRNTLDTPAYMRRGVGGQHSPMSAQATQAMEARQANLLRQRQIDKMTGETDYKTAYERKHGRAFNIDEAMEQYRLVPIPVGPPGVIPASRALAIPTPMSAPITDGMAVAEQAAMRSARMSGYANRVQ